MKSPKIYAIVAMAAAATIGATAVSWADDAGQAAPQKTEASPGETRVTEPLRAEHRELLPKVAELATAGDSVGVAPLAEQRQKVHASYLFLSEHLIPHAVSEDKVLYVKVDSLIGKKNVGTNPTDTMRRDHTEVGTLTAKLGELDAKLQSAAPSSAEQRELRKTLYALNGIVGLHFAKEEEVYLPLLDKKLSAAQAQQLFEDMEAANPAGAEHDAEH
jgi:iron-sulfur cluster repair protein YtfE (RIC family)